jgi:hypothetical protein
MLGACVVAVVATAGVNGSSASPEAGVTTTQTACRATIPNGKGPGHVTSSALWAKHGNGMLSAVLRRDGTLITNAAGGYKMRLVRGAGTVGVDA